MNKFIAILTCLTLISTSAHSSIEQHDFSNGLFTLKKTPRDWSNIKLVDKDEILLALQPKTKKSSFTIREFKDPDPSLKKNVVSWMRDYKSYGFKIIKSKPVKLDSKTYGYFIQAVHKKSNKVFKQYMTIKNKKLAVLTCHSDKAGDEFETCSKSLNSFRWKF